jgi:hypothetical protein
MTLSLPICRYLQSTDGVLSPQKRWGALQWVLSRSLCRFQTFSLAQVPTKSRQQALTLELAQWTPYANTGYYIGWNATQRALVWAWDADKARSAIVAQGLRPERVRILPEPVLQLPLTEGLALTRCAQGYEGQLWHQTHLERSRWWPLEPTTDEWLMFQRDAAIPPEVQQAQPPVARDGSLQAKTWLLEQAAAGGANALQVERLIVALTVLLLWVPTCWFCISWYKLNQTNNAMEEQLAQLKSASAPITQARSQSLDQLARINTLRALAPYPNQLALMSTVAKALPTGNYFLKDWDFQAGTLKTTIASKSDISNTELIGALQQAGAFGDVKALPGRDQKSVTFQLNVIGGAP